MNHPPTYVRAFSLHKVRENCHFLTPSPKSDYVIYGRYLLAIHGSCKIVNGSDRIERLGQNLQLFWFCTFSYFPLDSCTHYRPYQKKLTACLCLPHRRRLPGPWFSSWAITISNIDKSITYSSFIFQSVQAGASIAS